ncbi:MAG: hypothetical protein NC541_15890 [bacterium]|nr:hypothetical protein [bacterium]
MNRFEHASPSIGHKIAVWLPIAVFAVIFILFLGGVSSVSETTYAKQKESLETALSRSIAQCYAVEGAYPPDLQYLKDHYGLTYDESEFLVDYDFYGSNLVPDVTVLRRQNGSDR